MNGISGMYPNATLPNAAGVAVDFLSETKGFKDELLKVGGYGLKWIRAANDGQLSPGASRSLSTLDGAKNLVGVQEFLDHMKKFVEYTFRWITGSAQTSDEIKKGITQETRTTEMFFETFEMVNPAKDVLSFGKDHGLVALDPLMQTVVDSAGSAALIIGPGRGVYKGINEILVANKEAVNPMNTAEQNTVWEAKGIKSWLNVAKLTSYVVLGLILGGVTLANVAFAAAIVLNPLIPLALVTNALIFGLGAHFHEKLSVLTPQR